MDRATSTSSGDGFAVDELREDVGILLLAEDRLASPTPVEELVPIEELVRQFGHEDLLGE